MIVTEPEVQAAIDEGRALTHQEAFNVVWRKFVVEEEPASYNPRVGNCLYRSNDNSQACAIGYLIPDSMYPNLGEFNDGVSSLVEKLGDVRDLLGATTPLDIAFYESLQDAHDRFAGASEFTRRMRTMLVKVATKYNLTLPYLPAGGGKP